MANRLSIRKFRRSLYNLVTLEQHFGKGADQRETYETHENIDISLKIFKN